MILLLSLVGCLSRMVVGVVAPQVEVIPNASDDPAWETLFSGAESLDVSVRLMSAYNIVRYRPEDSGGEFTQRFLLDPSPYVQRAALEALIDRMQAGDDTTALPLLVENLHRTDLDAYTWGHLAHSLVGHVDGENAELISSKWESESASYLIMPLAMAAAEVGNTSALAALETSLTAADIPLELLFFDDCGESGLPLSNTIMDSVDRFEQVLHIPALVCALELGESGAESVLRDVIRSDANPERALEALDFVVEANTTAGEGAVHRLLIDASRSSNTLVSTYGNGALLLFGEGDPDAIVGAVSSVDRDVRVIALASLTRWWNSLGHTSTRRQRVSYHEAMVEALSDPNIAVVLAAIDALGHFAFPDDEEVLEQLLQSDDTMVRTRSASALLRLRRRAIFWAG